MISTSRKALFGNRNSSMSIFVTILTASSSSVGTASSGMSRPSLVAWLGGGATSADSSFGGKNLARSSTREFRSIAITGLSVKSILNHPSRSLSPTIAFRFDISRPREFPSSDALMSNLSGGNTSPGIWPRWDRLLPLAENTSRVVVILGDRSTSPCASIRLSSSLRTPLVMVIFLISQLPRASRSNGTAAGRYSGIVGIKASRLSPLALRSNCPNLRGSSSVMPRPPVMLPRGLEKLSFRTDNMPSASRTLPPTLKARSLISNWSGSIGTSWFRFGPFAVIARSSPLPLLSSGMVPDTSSRFSPIATFTVSSVSPFGSNSISPVSENSPCGRSVETS